MSIRNFSVPPESIELNWNEIPEREINEYMSCKASLNRRMAWELEAIKARKKTAIGSMAVQLRQNNPTMSRKKRVNLATALLKREERSRRTGDYAVGDASELVPWVALASKAMNAIDQYEVRTGKDAMELLGNAA